MSHKEPETQIIKHTSNTQYLALLAGSVVRSHLSGREYQIGKRLGAGGFGEVYRVFELTSTKLSRPDCCLKIAANPAAWHRESYFGDLFRDVPGVVRVYESFAWTPPGKDKNPLYCLISEFAEGGDLAHYLTEHRKPWKEPHARREIMKLLRTVRLLHDAGAVHRDLTPQNVFVTSNQALKLGDFGIASHRIGKHHVLADAFASWLAPAGMVGSERGTWRPSDDVYHLGQLFAMLLCGCAESKLTTHDVKKLFCTPAAKAVIQRCIGQRRKRFQSATEMLKALEEQEPEEAKRTIVRSLKGKRVVFTGPMSLRRADAERLVRKAGATVEDRVSHKTDIIVVGHQSPSWKADSKGQKLLDLDREGELGNQIAVITEHRFRVLTRTDV